MAETMTTLQRLLLPFLFNKDEIKIPAKFRDKVIAVQDVLESDTSGLLNSILDYAIDSASSVDYMIETSNANLSEILNGWLKDINIDMLGKIPTGINALSKQYYQERWKNSSFLVLRTLWEEVDGFILPTTMWFVDGEDVVIEDESETRTLGTESYELLIGKNKTMPIPANEDEMVFVQKPFEKWTAEYPNPFIIKRGLYKNAMAIDLLARKGDSMVSKAIEYMLLLKKGHPELVKLNNPDFTYSDEDLKKIANNLQTLLQQRGISSGSTTYATNFDTEMEHLIPEYGRILKEELFVAAEKRMLSSMGIIPLSGIAGSRQETMLNPKPFQAQVYAGVADFQSLMVDIIKVILQKNAKRKKYVNTSYIEFRKNPIKQFLTKDDKDLLARLFEKGVLSYRTVCELGVDVDFDAEVERRKKEKEAGLEELMQPHKQQYTDKAVDQEQPTATPAKPKAK